MKFFRVDKGLAQARAHGRRAGDFCIVSYKSAEHPEWLP